MDETYIYIGNLPHDATESMITDAFAGVATPTEVRLARAAGGGPFLGYAFAKLASKEEVAKAIRTVSGHELGQELPRQIVLDYATNQADLWEQAFGH